MATGKFNLPIMEGSISGTTDVIQHTGNTIRFFDIDGSLLKYQTNILSGDTITQPSNPNFDPNYLIFNSWNYSYQSDILNNDVDVGATYNTISGYSYIILEPFVSGNTVLSGISLRLYVTETGNTTVYWGDGNETSIVSSGYTTITHPSVYLDYTNYVITIKSDTTYLLGGNGQTFLTNYADYIKKIYLGESCTGITSNGISANSVEILSLPINLKNLTNTLSISTCHRLKTIIIPTNYTGNIGGSSVKAIQDNHILNKLILNNSGSNRIITIQNLPKIEKLILNSSFTHYSSALRSITPFVIISNAINASSGSLIQGSIYYNNPLKYLFVTTSSIYNISSAFISSYNPNLEYIVFYRTLPPSINSDSFTLNTFTKIYVPDGSVNAYKTATNWKYFANKIYSINSFNWSDYYLFKKINNI